MVSAKPAPGGGLCDIGPLSACAITSVFSAMPSSSSVSMSFPKNTSTLYWRPSPSRLRLAVRFIGLGMKEVSSGQVAT
jgi:hypothetical protein